MRKKRGPGRPPKPADEKQSRSVKVALTPKDWEEVCKRAEVKDLSLSAYLRERGLASLPSIEEMAGSVSDVTGGQTLEEFMRRLRDE